MRAGTSSAKKQLESPRRFATAAGRVVYALNFEVFPNFFGNVYVIDDGDRRILVDCGSGMDFSNENLVRGMASIEDRFGARIGLADIDVILITHGHMDHFGGLQFVRRHTEAPVGIHVLDRRVLTHYEERVVVASQQLRVFLHRAGLSAGKCDQLMTMYTAPKARYGSVPVQFLLEEGEPVRDGNGADLGIEVLHVPGHCPGQVCLRIDDVLLTADHVLARITPHQSPESLTLNMGLGHYLEALGKVEKLDGVSVGLGGHEEPIDDVTARVGEIRESHNRRLDVIMDTCQAPQTTADISRRLFGAVRGYTVLLALEEAGAHVEYLYQRGELVAENVGELESEQDPVVRYVRA